MHYFFEVQNEDGSWTATGETMFGTEEQAAVRVAQLMVETGRVHRAQLKS